MSSTGRLVGAGLVVVSALAVSACGTNNNSTTAGGGGSGVATPAGSKRTSCVSGSLSGAGSSFQDPMEQSWIKGYTSACADAKVTYQAVGSGAGIQQFTAGNVDFAGSDVTLTSDEAAAARKRCGGKPAIHLPVTAGGVGITYNLPGVTNLRLSPDTLAGIFQAKITNWNAPAIKADNPKVKLPNLPITAVHRSDSSGTNAVFSSYMFGASPRWKLGSGKTVNWPASTIGKAQNQGVSAAVSQTKGGITYTEQAFAKERGLPLATVQNAGKRFVSLTAAHVSTALESAKVAPAGPHDVSMKINYKPTDPQAYPISTVSYVITCSTSAQKSGAAGLFTDYLRFAVTDGQHVAKNIGFAPLPKSLVGKDKSAISSIS